MGFGPDAQYSFAQRAENFCSHFAPTAVQRQNLALYAARPLIQETLMPLRNREIVSLAIKQVPQLFDHLSRSSTES